MRTKARNSANIHHWSNSTKILKKLLCGSREYRMDHGPSIEITSLNWVEVGTVSRGVDSG
jgi:hypothetical protein